MINELLEKYWDAAYAEGMDGRNHDTEDGVAQRTLNEILAEFSAKDREIEVLRVLVAEVYMQAGNAAPPERRHALTPSIRDRMRTYLNGIGFWKSKENTRDE